ncbi:MAG TPA: MarR family transcriptional regulator [Thermoplasmata archaeon]|nr:MarR family transcriptional regulator [Thermoplasmata archaeon]
MTGRASLRNLGEVLRDETVERDRIAAVLRTGPKTIPELAESLGTPTHEVTKWVMAMRRFGRIRDLPKGRADDYFRYELVEAVQ